MSFQPEAIFKKQPQSQGNGQYRKLLLRDRNFHDHRDKTSAMAMEHGDD